MLAASLVILPCQDPLVWLVAALATGAEVAAVHQIVRRIGPKHDNLLPAVLCIQCVSWLLVIGFLSWVLDAGNWLTGVGMLVVWLLTLPIEHLLLRLACAGLGIPMPLATAILVVVVGNVVATVVTIGIPMLLVGF